MTDACDFCGYAAETFRIEPSLLNSEKHRYEHETKKVETRKTYLKACVHCYQRLCEQTEKYERSYNDSWSRIPVHTERFTTLAKVLR